MLSLHWKKQVGPPDGRSEPPLQDSEGGLSLSLSLAALHQATKHLFCTLLPRILLLILSPVSCFLSLNLAFGI